MALTTGARIIGAHAWFFREGASFTVPTAGTCAREAKPGADDTGWVEIGIIKDSSVNHEAERLQRFAPLPGGLRLYDEHETKSKITMKLTTDDISPLAIELLFGTLELGDASTQYNPLEGAQKRGWLKLQWYDQEDTLINTLDVWVNLFIGGEVKMGETLIDVPLTATVLHSSLNTGTL